MVTTYTWLQGVHLWISMVTVNLVYTWCTTLCAVLWKLVFRHYENQLDSIYLYDSDLVYVQEFPCRKPRHPSSMPWYFSVAVVFHGYPHNIYIAASAKKKAKK